MTVALVKDIHNSVAELQNFTYCFHITLQDGLELYLTGSDKPLSIDDILN
jgi:hypothetical protein